MGFFDRLLRRERHLIAPKELGRQLMKIAQEQAFAGETSLDACIRASGTEISKPPWEYNPELLIFSSFPFDVLLMMQFGKRGLEVREAFIEGLAEFVWSEIQTLWPGKVDLTYWPERVESRYLEYAQASRDTSGEGIALGLTACRRIIGIEDTEVATQLVSEFSMHLSRLREPLLKFGLQ